MHKKEKEFTQRDYNNWPIKPAFKNMHAEQHFLFIITIM